MSLTATTNVYKKLATKEKLTADDLQKMIYEFKNNVDQLESELKEVEKENN